MKKIFFYNFLVICALLFVGCTDEFEEINTNNNSPVRVTPQLLLPDIQRDVINTLLGETWGIGNIVIQHTAKNQFVNEDRYLWGEFNSIWTNGYGKLRDVYNIIRLAEENNDQPTKAVALIMKSWIYSLITDTYGDIPYSEAIAAKAGINYPKYDTQEEIYNGIISDLSLANDLLANSSGVVGGDIVYNGNITKWRKLANSLKIRYLIRISKKKNPGSALSEMISDASKFPLFSSNDDNGVYNFKESSPDQFPLYSARVGSFNEFRASKTLLDTLKSMNDPRLKIYYRATPATEGTAQEEFIGIPNGLDDVTSQTYAGGQQNHSRIGSLFFENSITTEGLKIAKGVIMTYAELQFLLAEASAKGWISGDSKMFYENGIKSSFDYYGLSVPTGYFDLQTVKWSGDQQENLNKIGFQKWISFYYQGMEAWFDWRRTGIPVLTPAVSNQNGGKIPVRFIYPFIEQALNGPNRQVAVSRQGGDDINTKMWYLQ
ncbi:MAG: SusD/RagB family nutrient-binding outer membrane lipoprotein [Saprospiraceae bacterium]|nr:SusD/RagB family nutrient-binding outer membrane lipoprotein [Saprospiraceae bacterium]